MDYILFPDPYTLLIQLRWITPKCLRAITPVHLRDQQRSCIRIPLRVMRYTYLMTVSGILVRPCGFSLPCASKMTGRENTGGSGVNNRTPISLRDHAASCLGPMGNEGAIQHSWIGLFRKKQKLLNCCFYFSFYKIKRNSPRMIPL